MACVMHDGRHAGTTESEGSIVYMRLTGAHRIHVSCIAALGLALAGCGPGAQQPPAAAAMATPAQAQAQAQVPSGSAAAFITRTEHDMQGQYAEQAAAGWVAETYITADTQLLAAKADERALAYLSQAAAEARHYTGQPQDAVTARKFDLLTRGVAAPAPSDAARRTELATIGAHLEALYGAAKVCTDAAAMKGCRNIDAISKVLAQSRRPQELAAAWNGWQDIGKPMRGDYERFVVLANEGARELGFADLGAMWRSGYDMPPEAFAAEVERLWEQVRPLYEDLHCYARARLAKRYGEALVPAGKPIPAELLGNLWAQQWNAIYDDILMPYPAVPLPTVDRTLQAQHYDARRMTRSAQDFYESLGFPSLPQTFWERSMLERPRDRDVVCHASAWSLDNHQDVRIKVCLQPTEEDLRTVYHELGHVHYDLAYENQPFLFQSGANDGFHEAIGDTVVLSMTPDYLARIGLAATHRPSREATINQQMKLASEKVAIMPFAKLVDQWRWDVFAGRIAPADYNKAWWALVRRYQGVAPPQPRDEAGFDPGAKYHIAGNTPYVRYFLANILQFQFHKALCDAAGFKGPLHECSVFGSKAAGDRFRAMLAAGASQPWPETLEKLTGTRQMDARPILEYFAPLHAWLKQQNVGQQCGWDASQAPRS